jgi:hypothetical protein
MHARHCKGEEERSDPFSEGYQVAALSGDF